jgi:holo-[acyl-carrier protein] synthase
VGSALTGMIPFQSSRGLPVRYDLAAIRVGVDLASVEDVHSSLASFGSRYTDRIYTAGELADSAGAPRSRAASLAARFAAKEAVLKVLRCPDDPPAWTDIEIQRRSEGWCEVQLSGRAAVLAAEAGLDQWSVSLTHEAGMAAAVVVASGSSR